jgi:DNA-binding NarL/FixJ family response regulator
MDLQMPEMNGLDALITIRAEYPNAKVIMLTTYEATCTFFAPKAGAQGYLLKNTLHSEYCNIRLSTAGKRSLRPRSRSRCGACQRPDSHTRQKSPCCVSSPPGTQQANRGSARHTRTR